MLALGDARLRGGNEEDGKGAFLVAADIARGVGATELLARAALGYGGLVVWLAARGDRHLIPLLEEALDALPTADSSDRARLMARLSCAVRDQPDRDRRLRLSEEALAMARRLGDQRTLAYTLDARCISMVDPGSMEAFRETALEIVSVAEELGEVERAFTGNLYLVCSRLQHCDIEGARGALQALTRHGEELRVATYRWGSAEVEAALALFEGRFDAAEEFIALGYEAGRDAIRFNAASAYQLQQFVLRRERGGLERSEHGLRELAAAAPEYHILRSALASLYVHVGQVERARPIFEELAGNDFEEVYYDEEYLASMTLLAEVCAALGDLERAPRMYELLLPHAKLNAFGMIEIVLGAVARPVGLLAVLLGRHGHAVEHFEQAIARNARMGARPWAAHTRFDLGRALAGRAEDERARGLIAEALDEYRALAMAPWAAKAERALDELGARAG